MERNTAAFLRMLDLAANGNTQTADSFINNLRSGEISHLSSVLLTRLTALRNLKDSLGNFATSDDVWGPGGTLDRNIAAGVQSYENRHAARKFEEPINVSELVTRYKSLFPPGSFSGLSDLEIIEIIKKSQSDSE